ncbi:phage tail protein [Cupriavidus neocaledonicus]|uniref:Phage tail protein n=1 Tax=Cupriavidus neocaledonicus TaxID=1040979 RepID=A0A375H7V3_9BURK|nr:phage tail protein [Cupriavidus neocaledonicus]SOZ37706.1 Phage-related tail protein (GpU) [Cupriavidus neocaledonicus]SPD46280.1 Phage tail protein [Cupriavidus neocaledonicus]
MMLGYAIGQVMMMQLGSFQFGITTAAYQELSRSTEYRWPSQERYGQREALQFTGPGADTMTLRGVIYPEWRGGRGQVERMRAAAAAGQPQMLVSGQGAIMGRWVVERIEEGQTIFAAGGVPRRQEFTMNLRRFD